MLPSVEAEYAQPWGPVKSTSRRAARKFVEGALGLGLDLGPRRVRDGREVAEKMVHERCSFRLPIPSDPSGAPASGGVEASAPSPCSAAASSATIGASVKRYVRR